jgi:hypothetical protein
VLLLNLIDDLEYTTYSNMGPQVFRKLAKDGFVRGRLVPVASVLVVSGVFTAFDKAEAGKLARATAKLVMMFPERVYRNPDLLARSWEIQRAKRTEFIAAFGADELIVPPAEAADLMRPLGYDGDAALRLPPEAMECQTVGLVFDEDDGLGIFLDYAKVKEMFADPALVRDRSRVQLLMGYLRSEEIKPGVLRRLAAAYPNGVDEVYRAALRQRHFTWSEHGEPLLRKHKPWYFDGMRRPGVAVIGSRLEQLLSSSPDR